MPPVQSKFGAPEHGTGVDAGKFKKLAQRVEDTLTKEALHSDPKQLDPDLVLVALTNRLGAPPNLQHVHFGILNSFLKNVYDRTRPAVGICIMYTSEEGKRKLLEHNKRFSQGSKLMPQVLQAVLEGGPLYGSLACTHLNLALRCQKQSGLPHRGSGGLAVR